MNQLEVVSLNDLVSTNHNYRKFKELLDFEVINKRLQKAKANNPNEGYGIERLFKCLFLQYLEDLSDRELERYLSENNAAKWFCGFSISEKTPDYTLFTGIRKKIGANTLSEIFADLRDQLKAKGYMSEVFSFVDATHLISKGQLWQERDKLIKQKYDKMNNSNISKVASDKEARIGCKGGNKFWFGYKQHVSVDTQTGMINKVALTHANVTDAKGYKHVCPSRGATYCDKGYCTKDVKHAAAKKNCHLVAIKRNNMKDKNKDLDKWISEIRAPYERVFSKIPKRVRYKGLVKNLFAAFMQAICFNVKRLVVLQV